MWRKKRGLIAYFSLYKAAQESFSRSYSTLRQNQRTKAGEMGSLSPFFAGAARVDEKIRYRLPISPAQEVLLRRNPGSGQRHVSQAKCIKEKWAVSPSFFLGFRAPPRREQAYVRLNQAQNREGEGNDEKTKSTRCLDLFVSRCNSVYFGGYKFDPHATFYISAGHGYDINPALLIFAFVVVAIASALNLYAWKSKD